MIFSGKILAGWVIDGTGGQVMKDVELNIRDGRVRHMGPAPGSARPLSGGLDFSDATLLPGLVDSHVHLNLSGHLDTVTGSLQSKAASTISRHLKQYLAHGVVAVRDGGDREGVVLAHRRDPDDGNRQPVAVSAPGAAFHLKGRYGGFIGNPLAEGNDLPGAVQVLAPQVDHIKIINSGLNSLKTYGQETPSQFTLEQLKQAVAAAAAHNRAVMVHANCKGPVGRAVDAGCRSVEHGYFMGKDNLMKLSDRRIAWVPTVVPIAACVKMPALGGDEAAIARKTLDHQLEQIALARKWGVRVAVGTDAGCPGVAPGAGLIEELKLIMMAGYPLEAAIQCASYNGARLMDFRVPGRLVAGVDATFVVVPGPPSRLPDSLAEIRQVYVAGEPV